MIIKSEKEYQEHEALIEQLIQKGTKLGDMELLTDEQKLEYMRLSEALDEYAKTNNPLVLFTKNH